MSQARVPPPNPVEALAAGAKQTADQRLALAWQGDQLFKRLVVTPKSVPEFLKETQHIKELTMGPGSGLHRFRFAYAFSP